ncbi:D-amino acid oxidase [Caulobacter sp. Root487D2Y]|uniref:FAD-dependent oxidoreductase n=1 Tax=Caulobacter sp. Root487D2Y TaxID=1736547 RepID=UPI0006F2E5D1|nr:FAD-dependent oxidoreductase [Caulobacter sp. Root487D2Y]KQY29661.1 D-amino acid oxidase [Caulobacter sp. Root487D2Y]
MGETRLSNRRAVLAGLGGLSATSLAGCVTQGGASGLIAPSRPAFVVPPLAPLRMSADRITKITVCLRPFRAAGPRLDVETVGDKRVVHNYGHGGSGWSLSWGSSTIAAGKALEGGTKAVAVIGCGALGLTSALLLQRAGAKVTIYAKERTPQTRSFRATGTWSPDSRVADADKVAPGFPALWEEMARSSYATYQTLLGLPGEPVSWSDRYTLFDGAGGGPRGSHPAGAIHFAEYGDRLHDIVPGFQDLPAGSHPFPVSRVRHGTSMQFNVTDLAHMLTSDFLAEGGKIVAMTFDTPADLARLSEPVVVNCTGYGARALWKDETITPVRGQIAWLAPQPEVRYGLYYKHVSVLPRPDGIVVQQVGDSDMWGYGVDVEQPDRAEAENAVATIAGLYARASSGG